MAIDVAVDASADDDIDIDIAAAGAVMDDTFCWCWLKDLMAMMRMRTLGVFLGNHDVAEFVMSSSQKTVAAS